MAIKTYESGSAEQLSRNFKVKEFSCTGKNCCSAIKVDERLVDLLQMIRDHFDAPVIISSGYRCAARNKAVGGAGNSRHTKGQAADISVKGIKPAEVAKYAESVGIMGIGLYENFVHIDTRTKKSFWYGHKQEKRNTFGGISLPQLKKGSKGETVKALQMLLNACGCACGKVDGIFGAKTERAVAFFKEAGGWSCLLGEK